MLGRIAIENDQANRALDETAERAEGTGQRTSTAFDGIGRAALGIGKFIVTAGAAVGGAWVAAIESTREYRAQMGLLDAAFQASGHSSTEAKNTYSDLNAVLGDTEQAVEAAQHMALLADNEKELSTWTNIATGVYATFGNSLPIESLAESSQEVSRSGVLTGTLIDALVWAGISEEEFQKKLDACTTEQERQDLIMNTLNGTYSKASEQYKETNKDVIEARKAQERLTDAFAELGRVGEPILTAIKNGVAKMVSAAVPKLESFIQKIKDAKKWLKDNKDTVDKWEAAIVGATVSVGSFLLILKWGAIMGAAKSAILGVRSAVVLLNAAMKANIIGLIVSLILGLIAAFVYLWKNNEGFRKFWIDLWAKIKDSSGKAINWIKGKFDDFKAALKTVRNVFGDIKDAISDKLEDARKAVSKAIEKIKSIFDFDWSLPKPKIPKITVSGGKAPFGIAGKGKLPSFDVTWRAQGAVFNKPTILSSNAGFQGVGDSRSPEAVAPVDILTGYIRQAVREESNTELLGRIMIEQTGRLIDALGRLIPKDVTLDKAALVGALLPAVDTGLSERYIHAQRGNVR